MGTKLDRMAEALSAKGDDAQRLELVERARRFKRSWIEMAEALVHVRDTRAYERWGYADLHAYCGEELQIKKATVDKLVLSYVAVKRHAPGVLRRDGVAQPIPSVEAVDYFARALAARPANDGSGEAPPADVIRELKHAVFDEHKPVAVLRREFDPVLRPKPEGAVELEVMERTRAAARRIQALLPAIEGLQRARTRDVSAALESLCDDLDDLIESARAHARAAG